VGRLEVIYGCMFAGKTTELIRRLVAAREGGLAAVAVKPRIDTRSGAARLATHTGSTLEALDIAVSEEIPGEADVIGIDEAHFFGEPLAGACRRLVAGGRRVIVAGVHLDHRGRPFAPFPTLLAAADEAVQLFAPCARCGRPAIHSHRRVAGEGRFVVGGADLYEPRCEGCFSPP
jgi:thymidine kinase